MKKEKNHYRALTRLRATFLLLAVMLVGTMLIPVPQWAVAGVDNVLVVAVTSTQTKVKTDGAPAKTYTEESVEKLFEGKGIGKKTLSAVCKENGIDLNLAKKKLAKQNIQMKDDETLFDAAQRVSKSPIDVMKIILKGEPIKK